jgi:hypothetical protein
MKFFSEGLRSMHAMPRGTMALQLMQEKQWDEALLKELSRRRCGRINLWSGSGRPNRLSVLKYFPEEVK